MALTKAERDALPPEHFAVPGKRKLPINDERHTRLANDMVDRTEGLTDEERSEAHKRIIRRAHELGMDTSDWSKLKAMSLVAMSLDMPKGEHPNKMPFNGILTRVDHVSEKPPEGSGGRRVIVSKGAAERAIPTLLGMGVNFKEDLAGHDKQRKIGIIDCAECRTDAQGPYIYIEGFIYASDFPDAAARIRADKNVLGFSFECEDIKLADPGATPLVVTDCVFTGAAILRKDKAAFMTTALAAQAESQEQELEDMDKKELLEILAEANKPTTEAVAAIGTRLTALEASAKDPMKLAAANMGHLVEPHAKALEACADGMEAAGIGGDPTRGHAVIARKMAGHMRASAALGNLPHIFRDHDFFSAAAEAPKAIDAAAITTAVEAAVKPLQDKIDAQGTTITDLKAKAFTNAEAPARQTVSAEIVQLMAKGGVELNSDTKLTEAQVDTALAAAKVTDTNVRIATKLRLQAAGAMRAA